MQVAGKLKLEPRSHGIKIRRMTQMPVVSRPTTRSCARIDLPNLRAAVAAASAYAASWREPRAERASGLLRGARTAPFRKSSVR